MAWRRARDSGAIEEIDLTMSSPEPEPQPRRPRADHQDSVKKKAHPPRYTTMDYTRAPVKADANATRYERPPSNITLEEVASLIDTTDKEVIKTVLLDLCRRSPGLTGALDRGITFHRQRPSHQPAPPPQSAFTSNATRDRNTSQYLNMSQTHNTRMQPSVQYEQDSNVAVAERSSGAPHSNALFVNPASLNTSYPAAHPNNPALSGAPNPYLLSINFSAAHSTSRTVPNSPSITSPAHFSTGPSQPNTTPTTPAYPPSLSEMSASGSIPNYSSYLPSGSVSAEVSASSTPIDPRKVPPNGDGDGGLRRCARCNETFTTSSGDDCFYHPGDLRTMTDTAGLRRAQYSCCERDKENLPCMYGAHMGPFLGQLASAFDTLKRPQITYEPSPSSSSFQNKSAMPG